MKTITRSLATGLLVLAPIVATFALLSMAFTKLNALVFSRMGALVHDDSPGWLAALLGIALTLALLMAVGLFANNFLGRRVVEFMDAKLAKLPLIKLLYGSIKDLLGAFVGDKKSFDVPVLVGLSEDGAVKVVGFVTRKSVEFLGVEDHVAVYLPQSYNFAGNVLLVPSTRVQEISANSSDVMAFLVSGGVSGKKQ